MSKPSIFETIERHVAVIYQGESRALVVKVREHGGRSYVTVHCWNRHQKLGVWYPNQTHPNRSGFSISVKRAAELGQALQAAVDGVETPKPAWLEAWEEQNAGRRDSAVSPDPPADAPERYTQPARVAMS